MATTARGESRSSPIAHSSAIGSMPAAVPNAVIRIGRVRTRTDSASASRTVMPRRRPSSTKSISRIEFFTTMPRRREGRRREQHGEGHGWVPEA